MPSTNYSDLSSAPASFADSLLDTNTQLAQTSSVSETVTAQYSPIPKPDTLLDTSASGKKFRNEVLNSVYRKRLSASTLDTQIDLSRTATNVPGKNIRVTPAITLISLLSRRVSSAILLESSAIRRHSSATFMEAFAASMLFLLSSVLIRQYT